MKSGAAPRVIVAPDSFKGTFTAKEVTSLISGGLTRSGFTVVPLPLADGGEGTLEVLGEIYAGRVYDAAVTGPTGHPVTAEYLVSADGRVAVIEAAAASGLTLVEPTPTTSWTASTYGTGELMVAASRHGVDRILLGVGGTATTDGGAGAISAIRNSGGLSGCEVTVLCDVQTAFEDAAEVFAPQKGADPETVDRLTQRLNSAATAMSQDPRRRPMTGAAGGLAGGLWAEIGAQLCSGIDFILTATDFAALTTRADAVVTGEGRLDSQTAAGKVIAGVLEAAARTGTPVHAVVGRSELTSSQWEAIGLASVTTASSRSELQSAGTRLGQLLTEEGLPA